ncbi:aminotransferase class I/II-fold pyridoxal phosphate-dependent enzyme [Marivirga harenae]|uniref:aminotransferase class I/II-fold pyridoxal phosphate-dependent enzyme n=1 Tax=Marivirga harenae TaxID=2010992 RepID=UPI0026E0EBC5|nr:pyridoxal phosphate-dependent aminotransferase family protein [Marivirga harenae]WKV11019.1 pyridoxal phosphate-dependent aminotransferase family protein [Marivirga harenae]
MNNKTKGESHLENILAKRKGFGGYRYLKKIDKDLIDFSSNDYLGLAKINEINSIPSKFVDNGAAGSRLLSGNKYYHEELENHLSGFFNARASLIFNSGYMANLGVLSSVPQKGDTVLMDELSHICIKEGVRLSRAKYFNFKHNDLNDLELKLQKAEGNKFIVVESVYSMDGDQAPLKEIVNLADRYEAAIIVDEAHSTGLYGESGFGLCCELGIEDDILARIYTFGKATGAHGAAVCGSEILKEYLINYSRQFIYTTALPYHSIASIQNALEYRKHHPELWEKLKDNIDLFRSNLHPSIPKLDSFHPVQGIIWDSSENTIEFSKYLNELGFDIRPILSPTVPKGKERVRICLHAFNSEEEITNLCHRINQYFQ